MYEEQRSDSPHIECVWQSRAVHEERYLVSAVEYWDLWFTRQSDGVVRAGLSGPSLGHHWITSTVGELAWGVQLSAHVVVPGVSKQLVLGGELQLSVDNGYVEISRHRAPVPEFDELTRFVGLLLELGALRSDDDVRRALSGDEVGYSERHWQRRVRASTGLTRKQVAQLARAREAFAQLQKGVPPAECAVKCGYADQAHLTRSLRVFHGLTPARILASR